jgi:hypothetical protein
MEDDHALTSEKVRGEALAVGAEGILRRHRHGVGCICHPPTVL